jgi:hypothetical protein
MEVYRLKREIDGMKVELKAAEEMASALSLRMESIMASGEAQLDLPLVINPPLSISGTPAPDLVADQRIGAELVDKAIEQAVVRDFAETVHADILSTQAATPAHQPNTDTSWQSVPTRDIASGIKGLGKKKLEALCDKFPTMGDIEAARAQASLAGEPFASLLPKGIGEGTADALENAMLDWLTENRDGMDVSKTNKEAGEDAEAAAEMAQKQSRMEELEVEFDGASPSALKAAAKIKPVFDDGRKARMNGEGLSACGWMPGDEQDAWLLGYMAGE